MIIRRAIKDTLSGQITALIVAVIGALLSVASLYLWKGRAVAIEEVPYAITGVVGAVGSLFLLFVWNLLCAPYRTQRDRADVMQGEIEGLQASLEGFGKPNFRLEIVQALIGSSTIEDATLLTPIVVATNVGQVPSALMNWGGSVQDAHGNQVPIRGSHWEAIALPNGTTLDGKGAIYNITNAPIPVGGFAEGHLVLTAAPIEDVAGYALTVDCQDVYGNAYSATLRLTGQDGGGLRYFKGLVVNQPATPNVPQPPSDIAGKMPP